MKRLLLFVLLIPFTSGAQYVGLTALAGFSYTNAIREQGYVGGITTRLNLTYPFSPRTVLGAYYETAAWEPKSNVFAKPALRNNASYGITYDVVGNGFFLGMKMGLIKFADVTVDTNGDFTYPNRFSFGLQGGFRQQVATGLYIVESVGADWVTVKGTYSFIGGKRQALMHEAIKKNITIIGVRVGVTYEFGHEPKKPKRKRVPMESATRPDYQMESRNRPSQPPKKTKQEKRDEREERKLRNPNRYLFGGG
jgi:hypothetical protein